MDIGGEELRARVERFTDGLKGSGIKLTHQRVEIFREVARTGDHPDAETIYKRVRKRIPTISLDTVYRTLWLLNDMGILTTIGMQRGNVRFDANIDSHHHFVCTRCGRISDFTKREFDELEVPREVSDMGEVASTHVQFRGLCNRCRGNN
ncbi:MAG: transcriptional repressor [Actinobacteria bacterium]|nr:transcriptional repressor [Actinomycetota bacterium]